MVLDIDRPNPLVPLASVYLDGELQKRATYADDELGIVERYKAEPPPLGATDWERETLQGRVEIRLDEERHATSGAVMESPSPPRLAVRASP